jgi:hypothetical protein
LFADIFENAANIVYVEISISVAFSVLSSKQNNLLRCGMHTDSITGMNLAGDKKMRNRN